MGFFKSLFGKKGNNTALATINSRAIDTFSTDGLSVHEDINDLIWIADGAKRNYVNEKKQDVHEINGIRIIFSSMSQDEPSLIYTKQPLAQVNNIADVERPPYYPTYSGLTPQQKGVYWKLLANPYNTSIDIGFVFILYYGLERHLLNGNYEKAFRIIIKLRDVHKNKSFQAYSGNALVLTCLFRQRADLAFEFMQSLDKEYELCFSDNLFLLCKYSLNIPLISKDIMRLAKSFEFNNTNYIKNYPELFEETLRANIFEQYNQGDISLASLINKTESKKIKNQEVHIFANISIIDKSISVPALVENFRLKKAMFDLLEKTHNQVKIKIAESRKSGELPPKANPAEKEVKVLVFDESAEKSFLQELKNCNKDFLRKHFALIALQDFYYKFRDSDIQFLQKCIDYCVMDIESLEQMQKSYYQNEVASLKRLSDVYGKSETDKRIREIEDFKGNIPAFKRLAIIFEKNKQYIEAIKICETAINYYSVYKMESASDEFLNRKSKLLSKVER